MEILLLAVALSMDCVALSMSNGAKCANYGILRIAKVSFVYGFFQGAMPIIGFFLGALFVGFIEQIDHFIAFAILGFLGVKMILDSRENSDEITANLGLKELISGAIATSIDALAVGVTFSFTSLNIWFSCSIIAFVCFSLSFAATFIGKKLGEIFNDKALILGGLILIFIGFKILITHLGIL